MTDKEFQAMNPAETDPSESKPDSTSGLYPMDPSVKVVAWVGGIIALILLAFTLWTVIQYFLEPSAKTGPLRSVMFNLFIGCPLWSVMGVYCLYWLPKVSFSKIEISPDGIARSEKDGSRVFIKWAEVERLTLRQRMKQIGVYGQFDEKKIMVNFEFQRFDQIKDRICEEFEKRLGLPSLPVTYCRLPVLPNIFFFLLVAVLTGAMLYSWYLGNRSQPVSFAILMVMLAGSYSYLLFWESTLVKALTLDGYGLHLHRIFGEVTVPFDQWKDIWQEPQMNRSGRVFITKLSVTGGKTYTFGGALSGRLDAYLILKKFKETKK